VNFYISTFSNKKFLSIVFVITLFFVIVQFIVLEYYTREKLVVMRPQTKTLMENHNNKLALLGTSHTNYGAEMNKIDNEMFDYGESYTYPIVMYQKLQKLIALNKNLKYLLVEADYHQFYEFSFTESTIYTKYAACGIKVHSVLYSKLSFLENYGVEFGVYDAIQLSALGILWFIFGFILVLFFRNSIQLLNHFKTSFGFLVYTIIILLIALGGLNEFSEFLYFNF